MTTSFEDRILSERQRMRGAVEIAERPDAPAVDCSDPQGCQN